MAMQWKKNLFAVSGITQVNTMLSQTQTVTLKHIIINGKMFTFTEKRVIPSSWRSSGFLSLWKALLQTTCFWGSRAVIAQLSAVVFRLKQAEWEIMAVIRLLLVLSVGSASSGLMCGCEGWWSTESSSQTRCFSKQRSKSICRNSSVQFVITLLAVSRTRSALRGSL